MNVYVVYCHPRPQSFTNAALQRTIAGLQRGGHDVRITDLYGDGFAPELSREEWAARAQFAPAFPPLPDDLVASAELLRWCEALVMVYPTWWSGQPGMLKGWVDRVLAPGVAYAYQEGTTQVAPMLTNIKRLVAVTTHGSSKLVNSLQGEPGKRTLTRAIRSMCSRRCRTTWVALYGIDRASEERRTKFLDRVERTMAALR